MCECDVFCSCYCATLKFRPTHLMPTDKMFCVAKAPASWPLHVEVGVR